MELVSLQEKLLETNKLTEMKCELFKKEKERLWEHMREYLSSEYRTSN